MFVESLVGSTSHPTIALLDHLGIGDKTVKCDVDFTSSGNCCEKLAKGAKDTANWIRGVEVAMNEAVEINPQNIRIYTLDVFLDMAVLLDERCNIIRDSHCKWYARNVYISFSVKR